jgi:arylsulfatase B
LTRLSQRGLIARQLSLVTNNSAVKDMRRIFFQILSLAAIPMFGSGALSPASEPPKPNIVYILVDDLGWKDVGFHGSDIKTPNIDKLAANGARLEQFYAQPMCTPTRAALMTGRYPFRYGSQTAVIPSVSRYGLETDEWLLSQALKEAGYKTAIIGKMASRARRSPPFRSRC